jgi:hypothetical protein
MAIGRHRLLLHIGLQIREVGVPTDVDVRRMIVGASQKRVNLRLVALEQHDFDRQMRLLVKVASHAFPNRHDLRIVGDGSYPDRSRHAVSSQIPCATPRIRRI